MARYRLLRPHFLGTRHFLAGQIIDWNGAPSKFMEPLDDEARAEKSAAEATQRAQGRPSKRPRTTNRVGMESAVHNPTNEPGDRPLWAGFEPDTPAKQPPTFEK
jgi:hypothetical protein